jgi:multidrug efflux system membrane fusion protein
MRRLKSSYLIAFVIAAAAVAWIVSGQMARKDDRAEAAAPTAAADAAPVLPKVRVAQRTAQPHRAEIVLRGRTEAVRSVDLRAETRGKIVEILAEKGASVRAGDVLLRLAADDRMAKLRQANALLAQRQIEYDSAKTLSAKGYRADTEVAAAEARLEEAKAHVASMEIDIGYTTIAAPFDGVVEARAVEIGHFVDIGDVMLRLVDLDPILVVGQVSEQDVAKLKPGMAGVARLVTGEQAKGRLRYLAATADESTRTFRVELEVANPERRIMQGLSTELRLPVEEVPAHLVSPAILTLNEAGQIGVKTVGADGRVEFHPVRIVGDGPSGVWLTGLPAQATVITVGQEFVNAGQQVETVPEGAAEPQS